MKFYVQVFHSYQTNNILLKFAFFHFWGIFWSFLGHFGSFLAHFGCEIQNPQITMKFYLQVFHSYQTKNILLKYAFSIFGAFLGHFGCEIQNSQIIMKFYFASISLPSDPEYLSTIYLFFISNPFLEHSSLFLAHFGFKK